MDDDTPAGDRVVVTVEGHVVDGDRVTGVAVGIGGQVAEITGVPGFITGQ